VPWGALAGLSEQLWGGLAEVLAGRPAERALDRFLRAHRALASPQRAAVAEAFFGVGLWRRRLRHALGLPDSAPASPPWLLFALLRDLAGLSAEDAAAFTGVDKALAPPPRPPPVDLATAWSFPDWLSELLVRDWGSEAIDLARALDVPGPICVRANTLRIRRDALRERLEGEGVQSRPTPYAREGLFLAGRPNFYGLASYREGLFEVQDEGSQLLGELFDAQPGESILDACAGAGGKTLQVAGQLQGRGVLYAHDPDLSALDRLIGRASRAGVLGLRIVRGTLPDSLRVERVLVDAPCSALGALRRGPDVRWRIDPSSLQTHPALQCSLLEAFSRHVLPGGRLVYATCTLRREENQEVALSFERSNPDFIRLRPGEGWLPGELVTDGFFQCLPHRHGTDGFFAAVWKRRG